MRLVVLYPANAYKQQYKNLTKLQLIQKPFHLPEYWNRKGLFCVSQAIFQIREAHICYLYQDKDILKNVP